MTTTISIRFKFRRGTAAEWTTANPVLLTGEPGLETDTGKMKYGDGTTAWNSLAYFGAGYTQAEIEEFARDAIGATLVAGSGITITPNDGADTITIASTVTSYTDENARDAIGAALSGGEGASVSVDDGADTIMVRSGSAGAYLGASGTYYLNLVTTGTLATIATAVDRFDFYPLIPLANDLTISALALYVTTGVASAKSRLGIYADNGGKPDGGALICDSGELDCATSSTGREGAVSVTLEKGKRYWLAVLSNSTQTLRSMPTTVLPLGVGDLSGTTVRNLRRATYTYAAMPATAPTTSGTSGTQVAIGLKIA